MGTPSRSGFGSAQTQTLIIAALLSLATSSARSDDGPFGIAKGADASTIAGCKEADNQPGFYVCKSVPRAHPDLQNYYLQAFPGVGVCWIKAASGAISSDAFGYDLKAKVDGLRDQLSSVYSEKLKKYDFAINGSMWNEPKYWMMGLLKGERNYIYEWSEKSGSKMKNGLQSISAYAKAVRTDIGYVAIEYTFENKNECEKAEKASKSKNL